MMELPEVGLCSAMRLDWWSMSDGHIPEAINGQQRITGDDEERRARARREQGQGQKQRQKRELEVP